MWASHRKSDSWRLGYFFLSRHNHIVLPEDPQTQYKEFTNRALPHSHLLLYDQMTWSFLLEGDAYGYSGQKLAMRHAECELSWEHKPTTQFFSIFQIPTTQNYKYPMSWILKLKKMCVSKLFLKLKYLFAKLIVLYYKNLPHHFPKLYRDHRPAEIGC